MVRCRKISRVLAFVGLYALAGTMMGDSALAAPLCARVMMPEISAADISATVASLASMKLRMDLLKVDGARSHELQLLNEQFPIKLAELQRALNDSQSEKQIRELITLEIAKQQGRRSEETLREKAQRTAERDAYLRFALKRTIPISDKYRQRFEYLPEQNIVLIESYDVGIQKMNLQTGHTEKLLDCANFWAVTADRQFIIHVNNSDYSVTKVNLQTGEKTPIGTIERGSWFQMDPEGHTLMTNLYRQLQIMHLHDGKTELVPWENSYPLLISESKILMSDKNDENYILDIPTREKQYIKKTNKNLDYRTSLGEGKFVLYSGDKALAPQFFDIKDLNHPMKPKLKSKDFGIANLTKTPLAGTVLLKKYLSVSKTEWGLYKAHDFQAPLFSFSDYTQGRKLIEWNNSFSFASDGESMAIVVNEKDPQGFPHYELHIWERLND